jgi:hypothetical protein
VSASANAIADAIEVGPADSKADREAFLRLPWQLYEGDPAWIPNLLVLQRELISEKKNPFFDNGEAQLFLARKDGKVVGRISAQIDRRHNQHHGERTGFFGFFESTDDRTVAEALLGAAEKWLRERSMDTVRGPFSFSIDQELGLLVEGFEHPPMVDMTHALPFYAGLIEGRGYAKVMDLLAYRWDMQALPERIREPIERTRAVPGLRVRTISRAALALGNVNMSWLNGEIATLLDIYMDAWQENWGYVPVTQRSARKIAADLRLIADPNIVLIAELDGEPVGMIVGIPNLYEAIRDFKGYLDPWKLLKLIWRLKVRGTETGRILLFGVKQKFQRRRELYGLPFLLLDELYRRSQKGRYKWCEESWILENNTRMNALMPYLGAHVYKRYRIYEKALA